MVMTVVSHLRFLAPPSRDRVQRNSESSFVRHQAPVKMYIRRKFRSQTSDIMDRWKAETGRDREKRRVEERGSEKRLSQKKEAQMREQVGKSRNIVFFQWFVAPEGRKVGSKKWVRSHLARWEMKKCTPLWREAHLQVKKLKTPHVRSTFGSWDV